MRLQAPAESVATIIAAQLEKSGVDLTQDESQPVIVKMINQAILAPDTFAASTDGSVDTETAATMLGGINLEKMSPSQRQEGAEVATQLAAMEALSKFVSVQKAKLVMGDAADVGDAPGRVFGTINKGPQVDHIAAIEEMGLERFGNLVTGVIAPGAEAAAIMAAEDMHDIWLLQNINDTHTIDANPDPTASTKKPKGRTILRSAKNLRESGNDGLITFFRHKNLDNAKSVVSGLVDAAAGRPLTITEGYLDAAKALPNHYATATANADPAAARIVKSWIRQMAYEVCQIKALIEAGTPPEAIDLGAYPTAQLGMAANHDRWSQHNNWQTERAHLYNTPFHGLAAEEQLQDLNALASTLFGVMTVMGWD